MPYQPFLIASLREGLTRDTEPWLLPDKAYPVMENMFSYEGVVQKKGGNKLIGRLGTRGEDLVDVAGVINTTLTWVPVEPGSIIITDGVTTFTDDGIGGFTITGGAGTVNNPTNYTTGAIDITFTAIAGTASALYYIVVNNSSPVMGLRTLEKDADTDNSLISFDMIKSYLYGDTVLNFRDISFYKNSDYEINWTGDNSDFFWTTNYLRAFWATNNVPGGHFYTITNITKAASAVITIGAHNFVNGDRIYVNNVQGMITINNKIGVVTATGATTITVNINSTTYGAYTAGGVLWSIEKSKASAGDGIRWYDSGTTTGWVNFAPDISDANQDLGIPNILQGCLAILPFGDRLVCFNTVEGSTYANRKRYSSRVRWSAINTNLLSPFSALSFPSDSPLTTISNDGWFTQAGKGSYADLPIQEEIVSVAYIKNSIVIYCENSTWRMDPTGVTNKPFNFVRVNSEKGSHSTFSTIQFDKGTVTSAGDSITQCDTISLSRIDNDIPELVYSMHNQNDGKKRVYGIRDYYNSVLLWTYTDAAENRTFPNRELVYNYKDENWAVLKNYYTCYGYYRNVSDLTWGEADKTWVSYGNTWGGASTQALFPYICAGNTHGCVFKVNDIDHKDEPSSNDNTFYIINGITAADPGVITILNHGFDVGDYCYISGTNGLAGANDKVYQIDSITADTITVQDTTGVSLSGVGYTYGGVIRSVDNFSITTKKFNPFYSHGAKLKIGYIDLLLESTTNAEMIMDLFYDENNVVPSVTRTVELFDRSSFVSNKFWYRVYLNSVCQSFSFRLRYSTGQGSQMFDINNNDQEVKLHGWILWAMPEGELL